MDEKCNANNSIAYSLFERLNPSSPILVKDLASLAFSILFEIVGEHYSPNVVRSRFGILLVKGVGFMQLRVSGSCGDCRNQISDNGA